MSSAATYGEETDNEQRYLTQSQARSTGVLSGEDKAIRERS